MADGPAWVSQARARWARDRAPAAPPSASGLGAEQVPAEIEASMDGIRDLVAEFEGRGLQVRYADRTDGQEIPPAMGLLLFELVKGGMTAAHAQHAPVHHTRIRVDGRQVVLSTQTSGTTGSTSSFIPDPRHRETLSQRVEAAGGQVMVRQTVNGNWLACVRLPLSSFNTTGGGRPRGVGECLGDLRGSD